MFKNLILNLISLWSARSRVSERMSDEKHWNVNVRTTVKKNSNNENWTTEEQEIPRKISKKQRRNRTSTLIGIRRRVEIRMIRLRNRPRKVLDHFHRTATTTAATTSTEVSRLQICCRKKVERTKENVRNFSICRFHDIQRHIKKLDRTLENKISLLKLTRHKTFGINNSAIII